MSVDAGQQGCRALYLSYDGMTDPLGGSQVLPYLIGLSRLGHEITLISCEKPERSAEERAQVAALCAEHGIRWHPLTYHKRPPVLSTVGDITGMGRLAVRLHRERRFDLVHCRSYLPALVGLRMKRRFGTRFLFDMRGFWADERVDGSLWNLGNPLFRTIYHWFKRRETEFLREADAVVSLTEAGKEVLLQRSDAGDLGKRITVIPCCTEFGAFPPVTAEQRASARAALAFEQDSTVVAYLGSIGTWYLLEEMLRFFQAQLRREPGAKFLVVTRDDPATILSAAASLGISAKSIIIRPARRTEVAGLMAAADYGLFFIRSCFSKLASSPVKLGELLALELPFVTNGGVGDVDRIVQESGAGVLVEEFTPDAFHSSLERLARLKPDEEQRQEAARRWFDLDVGVAAYDRLYRALATS